MLLAIAIINSSYSATAQTQLPKYSTKLILLCEIHRLRYTSCLSVCPVWDPKQTRQKKRTDKKADIIVLQL